MFISFDEVFHSEKKWKDIKLTDCNPCTHCDVTKEYKKHLDQIVMSVGFEDEIVEPCKTCKDYILWRIDCYQKLRWYEDHDERLK